LKGGGKFPLAQANIEAFGPLRIFLGVLFAKNFVFSLRLILLPQSPQRFSQSQLRNIDCDQKEFFFTD